MAAATGKTVEIAGDAERIFSGKLRSKEERLGMWHLKINFTNLISAGSLLFATATHAAPSAEELNAAGREGGGQGVICLGRCMTLAEAGLRIPNSPMAGNPQVPKTPIISEELYEEYDKTYQYIVSKLSVFEMLALKPHEAVNQFVAVEVDDPTKYDRIKREYMDLLGATRFPTEGFSLSAVSNAKVTYVLPEFTDETRTTRRTKVLTMFHERLWRLYFQSQNLQKRYTTRQMLERILSIDIGVLKLLQGDPSDAPALTSALLPFSPAPLNQTAFWVIEANLLARSGGVAGFQAAVPLTPELEKALGIGRYTLPNYDSVQDYESINFWTAINRELPQLARMLDAVGVRKLSVAASGQFLKWDDENERFLKRKCTGLGSGKFLYLPRLHPDGYPITKLFVLNCSGFPSYIEKTFRDFE